ncbi:MAG: hypothetical protein Tsb005_05120 [Gammaproteobacteria bacterium]
MGLGGNLIWTSVLKSLHERDQVKIHVCYKPKLSDLYRGYLFDRTRTLENDSIFKHNPRLYFNQPQTKNALESIADRLFDLILRIFSVKHQFERWVFARSEKKFQLGNDHYHLVHIDMEIHSYAEKSTRKRIIWKQGGRAAEVMGRLFRLPDVSDACELYFAAEEYDHVEHLIKQNELSNLFIVVEPHTNQEWFGELRAWPFEMWQQLVDRLNTQYPNMHIVQIGVGGRQPLDGVIDLQGQTSFREAALLLKSSRMFIGTEGGMMHAAHAVNVPAVILWGGVTLPTFAGYPNQQKVICHYVACAPCGQRGWCNNHHICMRSITIEEVFNAIKQELKLTTHHNRNISLSPERLAE